MVLGKERKRAPVFLLGARRVEFALGLESVEFQPGSLCKAQKSGFFVTLGPVMFLWIRKQTQWGHCDERLSPLLPVMDRVSLDTEL